MATEARFRQISPRRRLRRSGRVVIAVALAALVAVPATAAASQASTAQQAASASCPWVASRAPVTQRVAQLMAQMSLADEISMVEGHGTANPYVFYTPAIPALCIPAVGEEDGPAGVADGLTGVTRLPAGVALAATWDPSLAERYGQVIGAEEYGKGASVNLGPTVNIDRDPRWGRSFEALSEDPFLNASLGVPEIGGVQRQDVMSQVKHLAVYNQETYRNTTADDVIIDPADGARDLPAVVLRGGHVGRRLGHVLVRRDQRRLRLQRLQPGNHHPARRVGLPRLRDLGLRRPALHPGSGTGHRSGTAVRHLLRDGAADRRAERDHPEERAEHDGAARPDRDVPVRPVQPAADRDADGDRDHAGRMSR